jgi:hypothetical protein
MAVVVHLASCGGKKSSNLRESVLTGFIDNARAYGTLALWRQERAVVEVTIILVWLGCAFVSAFIAVAKRRSGFGWFLLGLIFGIFSTVVIAVIPAVTEAKPYRMARPDEIKRCVECGEVVLKVAKVCKHCGYRFQAVS